MVMSAGAIAGMQMGGDLASTIFAARSNAKAAQKQMDFQERMASTQYQRAAADLEKAGLNRIIALGTPASAPSGAMSTMENPRLGSSGAASYNSAKLANSQIEMQQEQIRLLKLQQEQTAAATEQTVAGTGKIRAETENLPLAGLYTQAQTRGIEAQIPGWQMIPQEKRAQIENLTAQLPKIVADARLAKANASAVEVRTSLERALAPTVNALVKLVPDPSSSAKAAGGAYDKAVDYVSHLIEDIVDLAPNYSRNRK